MKYEEAIGRLSEIVAALDKGDASLEDSIKLFEEGTRLAAFAQKLLAEAEQKVLRLVRTEDGSGHEEISVEQE
ncbi:MAG: exodeoxyribonuclease VII small subunit [Oscillospiraceae bacterium]|nr:exodeoxyribonuclease VII small subunit [Oscillospiraceae bacterium]